MFRWLVTLATATQTDRSTSLPEGSREFDRSAQPQLNGSATTECAATTTTEQLRIPAPSKERSQHTRTGQQKNTTSEEVRAPWAPGRPQQGVGHGGGALPLFP